MTGGAVAAVVISVLLVVVFVAGLFVHAYRNPHTCSGRWLIEVGDCWLMEVDDCWLIEVGDC